MRASKALIVLAALLLLPWVGLCKAWAHAGEPSAAGLPVTSTVQLIADPAASPAGAAHLVPSLDRTLVGRCERPSGVRTGSPCAALPTLDAMRRTAGVLRRPVPEPMRVPPGAPIPRALDPPRSH